ncbi:hypothetical protein SALBM311S_09136 [Streptomyces alboniger]
MCAALRSGWISWRTWFGSRLKGDDQGVSSTRNFRQLLTESPYLVDQFSHLCRAQHGRSPFVALSI